MNKPAANAEIENAEVSPEMAEVGARIFREMWIDGPVYDLRKVTRAVYSGMSRCQSRGGGCTLEVRMPIEPMPQPRKAKKKKKKQ